MCSQLKPVVDSKAALCSKAETICEREIILTKPASRPLLHQHRELQGRGNMTVWTNTVDCIWGFLSFGVKTPIVEVGMLKFLRSRALTQVLAGDSLENY